MLGLRLKAKGAHSWVSGCVVTSFQVVLNRMTLWCVAPWREVVAWDGVGHRTR